MTTRLNKKFREWTLSFLYRAIKKIANIKGNPNTEKTFQSTFMLESKDEVIDAMWSHALASKFLKIPEDEREERARIYDLDENIDLSQESLREIKLTGDEAWAKLKTAVTSNLQGPLKWWTGTRF